jgi:SAM-dependent methyltransferase
MQGSEEDALAALWKGRVDQFGKRCVLNLSHAPQNYDEVTARQKAILLPVLARFLPSRARRALDYGCGPGRFSQSLLDAMNGGADRLVVGYDICPELIDLAPDIPGLVFTADSVALHDAAHGGKFDLIWLCLVMGGVSDAVGGDIAARLQQSMSDNGLLFFVEHIAGQRSVGGFWRFRTLRDYRRLFPRLSLHIVDRYTDLGSPVSVILGVMKPRLGAGFAVWFNYLRFALRLIAWKFHREPAGGPRELGNRRK